MGSGQPNALGHLIEWLTGRINYERQPPRQATYFRLDAMRELLKRMGDPHQQYPIVHVAGTKGKGSVTKMTAAILRAAGYRTGAYTSPHLFHLNERFEVNGSPISDKELAELIDNVREVVTTCDTDFGDARLTFFDICTALAFLCFARHRVEVAVIEVGLGGRLDSTNVCQSTVSIITSISLDHTRQLGNTVSAIAREKAGIIKRGVPVIIGALPPEAELVIGDVARDCGAPVFRLGNDFLIDDLVLTENGTQFSFELGGLAACAPSTVAGTRIQDICLPLLGAHQADNATLAIAAAHVLESQGFLGLLHAAPAALASVGHAGRIQIVSTRPTIVLDVAHNVAAVQALLYTLQSQIPAWNSARKRWLVLSISRDKDYRGMIGLMTPHFDEIVLTQFVENPRARPTADLRAAVREHWDSASHRADHSNEPPTADYCLREIESPSQAWTMVWERLRPDDFCCVTGSLFLVAELTGLIEKSVRDRIELNIES